jgi:hypothetical protein
VHGSADGIEAPFYLNTAGHPVVLGEIVLAAALLEGLTQGQARYHSRFDVAFFRNTARRADVKAQEKPDVKARLSLPRTLARRRGMPV